MTAEHGDYTLKDVEVKLHDARRRLEGLLDLLKMDIPLPEDEIMAAVHDLAEAHTIMLNYYLIYKNGPITEEIVLGTPDNVIEFPNNKKED